VWLKALIIIAMGLLACMPANQLATAAADSAVVPGFAYAVQPGDTLERLALFYLGSQSYASAILIATNETSDFDRDVSFIADPYTLPVGSRIWIPSATAALALRAEFNAYERAVRAAAQLRALHRDVPLDAVPEGTTAVQAVTWTRPTKDLTITKTVPFSLTVSNDTWVTLVPALQEFCRKLHLKDLTLRLEQRLGLPPGDGDTLMVQFRVPLTSTSNDFFRPCLSPRIDTTRCPVDGLPSQSPSWYPAWFYQQYFSAYGETPYQYPWTALGYTYDWAATQDHVGESEYVIHSGTAVQVEAITPTATYCAAPA
jgi:hypothetical protein